MQIMKNNNKKTLPKDVIKNKEDAYNFLPQSFGCGNFAFSHIHSCGKFKRG